MQMTVEARPKTEMVFVSDTDAALDASRLVAEHELAALDRGAGAVRCAG
jgi:hypothetical protein